MKLIEQKWNSHCGQYERTWLADTEAEIVENFDQDCASGSTILVISTKSVWMKNTQGKWQKCGTTEVV